MSPHGLRLAYLYPDLMNLYGDRGNVLCLRERCRRRGLELEVVSIGLGEDWRPQDFDILFIGGGQDKEQMMVAADLQRWGDTIKAAVEEGAVVLAVCGGYQLFGRYYRPSQGPELPGIGLFDAETVHPGPQAPRCIGNVVARWGSSLLVGFENHGGRTYLDPGCSPLAQVIAGHGNNSRDRSEGAIYRHAYGTYLHGSLLPKNPHFADHLLLSALRRHDAGATLSPLDDSLEWTAHRAAARLTLGWRRFFPSFSPQ